MSAKKTKPEAKKYIAKAGSRLTDKDAQRLGPAIDKAIRSRGETDAAEAVLEAARDEASPLHSRFEWDDAKAGHEHRLTQARHLIRSIDIVRIDKRGDSVPIRAFEYVPTNGYVTHEEVASREELAIPLMQRFRAEVDALVSRWRRYSHLAEFAPLVDELDQFAKRVAPKKEKAA